MLDILIAGVGGQGTVLASKVLAQAAAEKGWEVRTAETIGMAQRGGSVTGHVRIGNDAERVHAPLITPGTADLIIALEPGEGLRSLPYRAPGGMIVSAATAIPSVVSTLGGSAYDDASARAALCAAAPDAVIVDDEAACAKVGNRTALNMVMIGAALRAYAAEHPHEPLPSLDDIADAVRASVKPCFVDMDLAALDAALPR